MRFLRNCGAGAALVLFCAAASPAFAADATGAAGLPGQSMALLWGLPFAGLLLSIATGPML